MILYVSVNDIKKLDDLDKPHIDICSNGIPLRIDLAKQKTGFGQKTFMRCPFCGKRREKLYQTGKVLRCRKCIPINVYKGIQHTTKGGLDYISYKMYRFSLKSGIDFKRHPFNYYDHERPKYKHWDKWCDDLMVMQALANMRVQANSGRVWSLKTINSILKWTNSLLFLYDLDEVDRYMINWDAGVDMRTFSNKDDYIVKI